MSVPLTDKGKPCNNVGIIIVLKIIHYLISLVSLPHYKMKTKTILLRISVVIAFALSFQIAAVGQFYNGSNQEFGKNRVQYKKFVWQYIRGDHFDTFFYEGGKDLAIHANEVAQEELKKMELLMDYPLDETLYIVVYTSQSDFRQSNVGVADKEGYNLGGKTQFIGNKMFIYFEGDYAKFQESIRYGLATILFNKMITGASWTELVRSSAQVQLPEWYRKGIAHYLANPNDQELLSFYKEGLKEDRYKNFNRLQGEETIQAGYALWYYIANVYGDEIIPNILYMTRISRSIETGMVYALGIGLEDLNQDSKYYFEQKFNAIDSGKDMPQMEELPIKTKSHSVYSQLVSNTDGTKTAYVSNELGQYKVWIYDELTGKTKKIYRGEHKLDRIIDDSYPVLAWNPTNNDLAIVLEKKGELWMYIYSTTEGKMYPRQMIGVDKVLSFQYAQDGKTIVMSAVRFGQTDLYLYYLLGNRQERLTNDINDDLDPRFVMNDTKVIFASNRKDDTLRFANKKIEVLQKDIFVMDLSRRNANLERITNTPDVSEKNPGQYDSQRYTYLGLEDGLYNRYIAEYDSVISRIDTTIHYRYFTRKAQLSNYKTNILEYEVNAENEQYTQLMYFDGRYHFFKSKLKGIEEIGTLDYEVPKNEFDPVIKTDEVLEVVAVPAEKENTSNDEDDAIDIHNYQFEGEEKVDSIPKVVIYEDYLDLTREQNKKDTIIKKPLSIRSYVVNFAKDQNVSQISNTFLGDFYQIFGDELSPGLSPLLKVGMTDIFEDYRVTGGARIALKLSSADFAVAYDNLLKRLDKRVTIVNQGKDVLVGFESNEVFHANLGITTVAYQVKWPFNEVLSVRGRIQGVNQRIVVKSTGPFDIDIPSFNSYSLGAKTALVFDNTIGKGLNLFNGSRHKIWVEYYGEYTEEGKIPTFGVAGWDFRHYHRIHRDIIFAGRFAGNTSFGSQKLFNTLGSVDNWILPRPQMDNTAIDPNQNYRYQAQMLPMRGFWRNARNGTSAAVINAEVRVPLFKYLMKRPLQSEFLENFQVVGFGDVGSAWTGKHPYSDENTFNVVTIDQNPFLIELENQDDPVIKGLGFGLRSQLMGYFVRVDWAWGRVSNRWLDREVYLSFNLDF